MPTIIIAYSALQPPHDLEAENTESYWPSFVPVETLRKWKGQIGSIDFASQYLSDPIDTHGNYLRKEWIKVYQEQPDVFERIVAYVDPAPTQATKSDYFTVATVGLHQNRCYLLELIRSHAHMQHQRELLESSFSVWHHSRIFVESTASQQYLVDYLAKETQLPIEGFKPRVAKPDRIEAGAARLETGRALLPGFYDETGELHLRNDFQPFLEEYLSYPRRDAHDDTLDAVFGAIEMVATNVEPAFLSDNVYQPTQSNQVKTPSELEHERELQEALAYHEQQYGGLRRSFHPLTRPFIRRFQ